MGNSLDPSNRSKIEGCGILIEKALVHLEPRKHDVLNSIEEHVMLGAEGD